MPELTPDERHAIVRASRIDRLTALLRMQFQMYADYDPLLSDELDAALMTPQSLADVQADVTIYPEDAA